jgi:hypothetical protein
MALRIQLDGGRKAFGDLVIAIAGGDEPQILEAYGKVGLTSA